MLQRLLVLSLFVSLPLFGDRVRAVLEPKEQTLITSEVNSTVNSIDRRMGESFEEGVELILLNDVVFLANLMKAEAQLSKAQTDFESAEQLYKDRVISHSEFREAEAAVAVAKADLALATKAHNACFIKAPYNGKVIDVYVKQYERVQPGQNLIAILDDSTLIARLLVPEAFVGRIKIGDVVQVRVEETKSLVDAKIIRMGAVIDPVSSLMKVEAEIDNSTGELRPGMEGTLVLRNSELKRP